MEGLSLSGAINGSNYSIEMDFEFGSTSGYRKIIDFKDLAADTGLYNYSTELNFYNEADGPGGAFANGLRCKWCLLGTTRRILSSVT